MEKPDFSVEVNEVEQPLEIEPTPVPNTNPFVSNTAQEPLKNEIIYPAKPAQDLIAETIEIENPHAIFPHIVPYPETSPKQHHFRFKHKTDQMKLIQHMETLGMTVEFNETGKNNMDVTLMRGSEVVGKIQLLHFDRRDRKIRSKHYVKLYFYQFQTTESKEEAKNAMREFFKQLAIQPHRSLSRRRPVTRKLRHKRRKQTIRRV
jgi:hypothetical protein